MSTTTDQYPAIPLGYNGLEVDLYEWVPGWKAWVYTGSYSLKQAIAACFEQAPEQDFAVFPFRFDPNKKLAVGESVGKKSSGRTSDDKPARKSSALRSKKPKPSS